MRSVIFAVIDWWCCCCPFRICLEDFFISSTISLEIVFATLNNEWIHSLRVCMRVCACVHECVLYVRACQLWDKRAFVMFPYFFFNVLTFLNVSSCFCSHLMFNQIKFQCFEMKLILSFKWNTNENVSQSKAKKKKELET